MKESTQKYTAMHPNVTFELVLQSTESLVDAFRAAGAAGEGPDIQYFWGGILTIEDAWNGYIVPISDYLSQEELSHMYTRNERYMGMLRDNGYLNSDYQSIQLYQAMQDFMAGKGAISFGV